MSAEHVGWAFRQQELSPTRKLVLVALADRCNKDTLRCDPSIRRLIEDTGLGRRTIFRALEELEEGGFIRRVERTRQNGSLTSSEYCFPSVTVTRGEYQGDTGGSATVAPPEPETLEPEVEPTSLAAAPPHGNGSYYNQPVVDHPEPRARNEIWDALGEIFGEPTTRGACQVRGKVVASLRSARASPDEITARAKRWPLHFDTATLTDLALEKHWDTLGRKPLRRQ